MEKEQLATVQPEENCEIQSIATDGDLEISGGVLYVGDYHKTFESGPVACGGTLVAEGLNAGCVHVTEDFLASSAILEELTCGGDVEAEYLFCEGGAYVLGNITVNTMVSQTHHVFCGGKFTGNFYGDSHLLHEQFEDWGNIKDYL